MNTYLREQKKHTLDHAAPDLATASGQHASEGHQSIPNSVLADAMTGIRSHHVDLDVAMRQKMEDRFGVPMTGLKVFRDEGLHGVGAKGYAKGNEIHVAAEDFSEHSAAGQELLFHEAGHVIQQGSGLAHGGGVLFDEGLEAQASMAFAAPQSFAMPTSADGPIQGMFGGIGRLLKKAFGRGQGPGPAQVPAPPAPAPPAAAPAANWGQAHPSSRVRPTAAGLGSRSNPAPAPVAPIAGQMAGEGGSRYDTGPADVDVYDEGSPGIFEMTGYGMYGMSGYDEPPAFIDTGGQNASYMGPGISGTLDEGIPAVYGEDAPDAGSSASVQQLRRQYQMSGPTFSESRRASIGAGSGGAPSVAQLARRFQKRS